MWVILKGLLRLDQKRYQIIQAGKIKYYPRGARMSRRSYKFFH